MWYSDFKVDIWLSQTEMQVRSTRSPPHLRAIATEFGQIAADTVHLEMNRPDTSPICKQCRSVWFVAPTLQGIWLWSACYVTADGDVSHTDHSNHERFWTVAPDEATARFCAKKALEDWKLPARESGVWNQNALVDVTNAICDTPRMWLQNFDLKYLNLRIDTRDGSFIICDRHGKIVPLDKLISTARAADALYGKS